MKHHEDKLLRENIAQLIKDHGARPVQEGLNREVLDRMEGLLESCNISLNDVETIDYLIATCVKSVQEKKRDVALSQINPNETQSILEGLVHSVTPKVFAQLLRATQAVNERKALGAALEKIFSQISDREIKHVIKRAQDATQRPKDKIYFGLVKNSELGAQLVTLLETYGGPMLTEAAQRITDNTVQQKINAQITAIADTSPFHYAAAVGAVVNIMRYAAENHRER